MAEEKKTTLEEAAEELFETMEIQEHENIFEDTFKKIFHAGAEWQKERDDRDLLMSDNRHFEKVYELGKKDMKEQMLKDAVEVIMRPDDCEIWVNLVGYGYKFNDGDKAKIIIIPNKEDKE